MLEPVHRDAAVALDNAVRLDRFSSALAVQALQRQGSVADDMEPLDLAVDREAGFGGMQGGALQMPRDSGLLSHDCRASVTALQGSWA
ncbi:MAG: hypothetical protein OXQ89_03835 [Rhodospirillaceae bacterium]|nr:hypothetical protein [Rhodospirillaceae bacterium]